MIPTDISNLDDLLNKFISGAPPGKSTRRVQISKSHSVTQRATEQQENGVSDPCEYLADTLLPDSGFELIDHFDLQGGGFISL